MASSAQWFWPLPGPPSHLLTKPEEVPALAGTGILLGPLREGPVMATCDQAAGVSLLMWVIPQGL